MKLHEYLESANENLNYGNITKDNFWNRGIWVFTNTKEMIVHEKTLEILEVHDGEIIYILDDYIDKYKKLYGNVDVRKMKDFVNEYE